MKRKYKVPKYKGLDDLFSEFIRRRALKRVGGCERCLAPKSDYRLLDNSHFKGRRMIATRFDEDNCSGLCGGCHRWLDSQPDEYCDWQRDHIGNQRYHELLIRSRIVPANVDINLLTLYYQEKLRAL